jgi:hypothetical protein
MTDFEGWNKDMRVRSITKIDSEGEDVEKVTYKLVATDRSGNNKVVITSDQPFPGLSARDGVIELGINNSQLTINDFRTDANRGE